VRNALLWSVRLAGGFFFALPYAVMAAGLMSGLLGAKGVFLLHATGVFATMLVAAWNNGRRFGEVWLGTLLLALLFSWGCLLCYPFLILEIYLKGKP
jgi:hypothetical protein